ncbi:MAG: penicillin-binding protein 2 [Armatimonadota bacterium]|nr:penicillin-binding protein 2 [Armatimonadota bacterium]
MPEHDPNKNRLPAQAWLLPVLVAVGLLVVLFRLWYLQMVRGDALSQQALQGRTISIAVSPPRGVILDRKGRPLAGVKPALALMVVPAELHENEEAIARLVKICELDREELEADIKENLFRRFLPFVAKLGITTEQAIAVEEKRAFLPGVFVRPESVRQYPSGAAAAHVVGYVGVVSPEDVDRLTADGQRTRQGLPSFVGKVGVERVFDKTLMGLSGRDWVEIDTRGRPLRDSTSDAPTPGSTVVLTIDMDLQRTAESLLAGRKGAVVAIDPNTGEILCLASGPSFDPNVFARRAPRATIKSLLIDKRLPLLDRAVASSYAPGSTFKIATFLAGVNSGVLTEATHFTCTGSMRVGARSFRCLGQHGSIAYHRAMQKSCNIFFAKLGQAVDREGLANTSTLLGLGQKTGIDLLSERPGSLPTDDWLAKRELKWYPGDTVNMAVGQGYVGCTPLQMANYIATIASRGSRYAPHLVKAIIPPGADALPQLVEPQIVERLEVSEQWWDRLFSALVAVVEGGTAKAAQIPGITVAGKTGSSEHTRGSRTHGWFVGFAPAEKPRIAIAVVLEAAGHGGEVAVPVAKQVIERYLKTPASLISPKRDLTASADSTSPSDR